jgi:hypothetical protein
MSERILSRDAMFGVTEYFIPSEDGDSFTIRTEFDPTPLFDINKNDINEAGSSRWGDGKLVARIPLPIYYDWLRKGYIRDSKKLRALLNDSDNSFMRCWPGNL